MAITTVPNCKAFLNIPSDNKEHDAELARIIASLEAFLEMKTGRKIKKETITEYFDGDDWRDRLLVARPPIESIVNLWDDTSRVWSVPLAASTYETLNPDAGIIRLLDGLQFSRGRRNIKLTYIGGYEGAIPGIEQEVIELVWAAREKGQYKLIGVRNRSIADGSTQWMNLDWDTSPVAMSVVNKLSLKTGVA